MSLRDKTKLASDDIEIPEEIPDEKIPEVLSDMETESIMDDTSSVHLVQDQKPAEQIINEEQTVPEVVIEENLPVINNDEEIINDDQALNMQKTPIKAADIVHDDSIIEDIAPDDGDTDLIDTIDDVPNFIFDPDELSDGFSDDEKTKDILNSVKPFDELPTVNRTSTVLSEPENKRKGLNSNTHRGSLPVIDDNVSYILPVDQHTSLNHENIQLVVNNNGKREEAIPENKNVDNAQSANKQVMNNYMDTSETLDATNELEQYSTDDDEELFHNVFNDDHNLSVVVNGQIVTHLPNNDDIPPDVSVTDEQRQSPNNKNNEQITHTNKENIDNDRIKQTEQPLINPEKQTDRASNNDNLPSLVNNNDIQPPLVNDDTSTNFFTDHNGPSDEMDPDMNVPNLQSNDQQASDIIQIERQKTIILPDNVNNELRTTYPDASTNDLFNGPKQINLPSNNANQDILLNDNTHEPNETPSNENPKLILETEPVKNVITDNEISDDLFYDRKQTDTLPNKEQPEIPLDRPTTQPFMANDIKTTNTFNENLPAKMNDGQQETDNEPQENVFNNNEETVHQIPIINNSYQVANNSQMTEQLLTVNHQTEAPMVREDTQSSYSTDDKNKGEKRRTTDNANSHGVEVPSSTSVFTPLVPPINIINPGILPVDSGYTNEIPVHVKKMKTDMSYDDTFNLSTTDNDLDIELPEDNDEKLENISVKNDNARQILVKDEYIPDIISENNVIDRFTNNNTRSAEKLNASTVNNYVDNVEKQNNISINDNQVPETLEDADISELLNYNEDDANITTDIGNVTGILDEYGNVTGSLSDNDDMNVTVDSINNRKKENPMVKHTKITSPLPIDDEQIQDRMMYVDELKTTVVPSSNLNFFTVNNDTDDVLFNDNQVPETLNHNDTNVLDYNNDVGNVTGILDEYGNVTGTSFGNDDMNVTLDNSKNYSNANNQRRENTMVRHAKAASPLPIDDEQIQNSMMYIDEPKTTALPNRQFNASTVNNNTNGVRSLSNLSTNYNQIPETQNNIYTSKSFDYSKDDANVSVDIGNTTGLLNEYGNRTNSRFDYDDMDITLNRTKSDHNKFIGDREIINNTMSRNAKVTSPLPIDDEQIQRGTMYVNQSRTTPVPNHKANISTAYNNANHTEKLNDVSMNDNQLSKTLNDLDTSESFDYSNDEANVTTDIGNTTGLLNEYGNRTGSLFDNDDMNLTLSRTKSNDKLLNTSGRKDNRNVIGVVAPSLITTPKTIIPPVPIPNSTSLTAPSKPMGKSMIFPNQTERSAPTPRNQKINNMMSDDEEPNMTSLYMDTNPKDFQSINQNDKQKPNTVSSKVKPDILSDRNYTKSTMNYENMNRSISNKSANDTILNISTISEDSVNIVSQEKIDKLLATVGRNENAVFTDDMMDNQSIGRSSINYRTSRSISIDQERLSNIYGDDSILKDVSVTDEMVDALADGRSITGVLAANDTSRIAYKPSKKVFSFDDPEIPDDGVKLDRRVSDILKEYEPFVDDPNDFDVDNDDWTDPITGRTSSLSTSKYMNQKNPPHTVIDFSGRKVVSFDGLNGYDATDRLFIENEVMRGVNLNGSKATILVSGRYANQTGFLERAHNVQTVASKDSHMRALPSEKFWRRNQRRVSTIPTIKEAELAKIAAKGTGMATWKKVALIAAILALIIAGVVLGIVFGIILKPSASTTASTAVPGPIIIPGNGNTSTTTTTITTTVSKTTTKGQPAMNTSASPTSAPVTSVETTLSTESQSTTQEQTTLTSEITTILSTIVSSTLQSSITSAETSTIPATSVVTSLETSTVVTSTEMTTSNLETTIVSTESPSTTLQVTTLSSEITSMSTEVTTPVTSEVSTMTSELTTVATETSTMASSQSTPITEITTASTETLISATETSTIASSQSTFITEITTASTETLSSVTESTGASSTSLEVTSLSTVITSESQTTSIEVTSMTTETSMITSQEISSTAQTSMEVTSESTISVSEVSTVTSNNPTSTVAYSSATTEITSIFVDTASTTLQSTTIATEQTSTISEGVTNTITSATTEITSETLTTAQTLTSITASSVTITSESTFTPITSEATTSISITQSEASTSAASSTTVTTITETTMVSEATSTVAETSTAATIETSVGTSISTVELTTASIITSSELTTEVTQASMASSESSTTAMESATTSQEITTASSQEATTFTDVTTTPNEVATTSVESTTIIADTTIVTSEPATATTEVTTQSQETSVATSESLPTTVEETTSAAAADTTSAEVTSAAGDTTSAEVTTAAQDTTSAEVTTAAGDTTSAEITNAVQDTTSAEATTKIVQDSTTSESTTILQMTTATSESITTSSENPLTTSQEETTSMAATTILTEATTMLTEQSTTVTEALTTEITTEATTVLTEQSTTVTEALTTEATTVLTEQSTTVITTEATTVLTEQSTVVTQALTTEATTQVSTMLTEQSTTITEALTTVITTEATTVLTEQSTRVTEALTTEATTMLTEQSTMATEPLTTAITTEITTVLTEQSTTVTEALTTAKTTEVTTILTEQSTVVTEPLTTPVTTEVTTILTERSTIVTEATTEITTQIAQLSTTIKEITTSPAETSTTTLEVSTTMLEQTTLPESVTSTAESTAVTTQMTIVSSANLITSESLSTTAQPIATTMMSTTVPPQVASTSAEISTDARETTTVLSGSTSNTVKVINTTPQSRATMEMTTS